MLLMIDKQHQLLVASVGVYETPKALCFRGFHVRLSLCRPLASMDNAGIFAGINVWIPALCL